MKAGVPPHCDQVPPLDNDLNDDQARVNTPPFTDEDIQFALFQIDNAITTQTQASTTQSQAITTQAN